jgi:hypothetical protein
MLTKCVKMRKKLTPDADFAGQNIYWVNKNDFQHFQRFFQTTFNCFSEGQQGS